jgi:hypothetical protein
LTSPQRKRQSKSPEWRLKTPQFEVSQIGRSAAFKVSDDLVWKRKFPRVDQIAVWRPDALCRRLFNEDKKVRFAAYLVEGI